MSGCAILAAPSPWPVLLQTTPSRDGIRGFRLCSLGRSGLVLVGSFGNRVDYRQPHRPGHSCASAIDAHAATVTPSIFTTSILSVCVKRPVDP